MKNSLKHHMQLAFLWKSLVSFSLLTGPSLPHISWAQDQLKPESTISAPLIRYVGKENHQPITFGLESELDVERYPHILDFYKPLRSTPENLDDKYEPTDEEWNALSTDEKMELFRKHHFKEKLANGKLFSRWEGTDVIRYQKLNQINSSDPQTIRFWQMLHPTLAVEPRGNVEVNGLVFNDLRAIKKFFDLLKSEIGEGDTQAHIVFPDRSMKNVFGLSLYFHDKSFLRRLVQEDHEFKLTPHLTPAMQANSDWDGLFSNVRKEQIKKIEGLIEKGEFPRGDYSRVYRAGIPTINKVAYPNHLLGFELRNEDNPSENTRTYVGSYARLVENLDMISKMMEKDPSLALFSPFNDIEVPYDLNLYEVEKTHGLIEENALEKNKLLFSKRMQQILSHLKPAEKEQVQSLLSAFNDESPIWNKIEANVRNFFSQRSTMHAIWHVFRDWDNYPVIATLPLPLKNAAIDKINLATIEFLKDILFADKNSSLAAFPRKVRVAFAKWSKQAEIYKHFPHFEQSQGFAADAEFAQNFNIETNPAQLNHFPKSNPLLDLIKGKKDKTKEVLTMLAQGTDLDSIDRHHYTPVARAAEWGKSSLINFLMTNGADPNKKTLKGGTPLLQAAFENEEQALLQLLRYPSVRQEINTANKNNMNPLAFAIRNNNLNLVKALVQAGSNTITLAGKNKSALEFAHSMEKKNPQILEYLTHLPSLQENFLQALKSGNGELLEKLYTQGAYLNHGVLDEELFHHLLENTNSSSTPQLLEWILNKGLLQNVAFNPLIAVMKKPELNWAFEQLIRSPYFNPHQVDAEKSSALDYALKNNLLSESFKLLQLNLPYQKSSIEQAALRTSTMVERFEKNTEDLLDLIEKSKTEDSEYLNEIKSLLVKGVNLSKLSKLNKNALVLSLEKGFHSTLELFLKRAVDINQISPFHGETLLSLAIKMKDEKLVHTLLKDPRIDIYRMNQDFEAPALLLEDRNLDLSLSEFKNIEKNLVETGACPLKINTTLFSDLESSYEELMNFLRHNRSANTQAHTVVKKKALFR